MKTYISILAFVLVGVVFAQEKSKGEIFNFNFCEFKKEITRKQQTSRMPIETVLEFNVSSLRGKSFLLKEQFVGQKHAQQIITTFNGVTADKKYVLKLTLTPNKITGMLHTPQGKFIIEPYQDSSQEYIYYPMKASQGQPNDVFIEKATPLQ